MTTGIDLIGQERQHQIDKGYTPEYDAQCGDHRLLTAAVQLVAQHDGWLADRVGTNRLSAEIHAKHCRDLNKELVIAGALIAAALDVRALNEKTPEEFWRVEYYNSKGRRIESYLCHSIDQVAARIEEANARCLPFTLKHFKEQV